jgi:hypothetical protein
VVGASIFKESLLEFTLSNILCSILFLLEMKLENYATILGPWNFTWNFKPSGVEVNSCRPFNLPMSLTLSCQRLVKSRLLLFFRKQETENHATIKTPECSI